jgi:hypothetical protein
MGGEGHDVTAAERGSPDGDPRGIHTFERAGIGNRRSPVLKLTTDVQQLARLPVAVAEIAVIENAGREPGLGEALGVCVEALVAHSREAVRQDYARGWTATVFRWTIEPRRAPVPADWNVTSLRCMGSPPGSSLVGVRLRHETPTSSTVDLRSSVPVRPDSQTATRSRTPIHAAARCLA